MNPEQQALMTEGYLLDVLGKTSSTFIELAVARIESADGTKYYDPDTDTMLFETMALADLFR